MHESTLDYGLETVMKLYTYFRSSAAYRVRIALNLKGINYQAIPVHLVRDGGQQHSSDYRRLNPAGLVPSLDDNGQVLTQSLPIIEYLDETHPEPPLLPRDAAGRARVRAMAQLIASEIHPINNLRVLRYLEHQLGASQEQRNAWYRHWVESGLTALEQMVASHPDSGRFMHGDDPTIADCALIPQLFNARRFSCNLDGVPSLLRIAAQCEQLEAFRLAAPEQQADAE